MTDNVNQALSWLKDFKNIWLPQNIPNDAHLLQSITTKLSELEQLINETNNNDDAEEFHRAKLLNEHSSDNSDTEQVNIASTSTHELSLENSILTPPENYHSLDNDNEEQQSRQVLLEQSDSSENQQQEKSSSEDERLSVRPIIRLKRISKTEAESYIPLAWRNGNSNVSASASSTLNNRTNIRGKHLVTASGSDNVVGDSNTSQILNRPTTKHNTHGIPSDKDERIQGKVTASEIDRTSVSSEERQNNETSTTSSTSDDDDSFTITTRTRKSQSNKTEKSVSKSHKQKTNSHKKERSCYNL